MKPVANQRVIEVHKEPTNKENLYTTNNMAALDEAARRLQSKGGFKLYMYLAKNQHRYKFALSSSDFCVWSGLGMGAYRSAFEELVKEGYLIQQPEKETLFIFYDKSQNEEKQEQKEKTGTEVVVPEKSGNRTGKIINLVEESGSTGKFIF